jgi:hypothetical protein
MNQKKFASQLFFAIALGYNASNYCAFTTLTQKTIFHLNDCVEGVTIPCNFLNEQIIETTNHFLTTKNIPSFLSNEGKRTIAETLPTALSIMGLIPALNPRTLLEITEIGVKKLQPQVQILDSPVYFWTSVTVAMLLIGKCSALGIRAISKKKYTTNIKKLTGEAALYASRRSLATYHKKLPNTIKLFRFLYGRKRHYRFSVKNNFLLLHYFIKGFQRVFMH